MIRDSRCACAGSSDVEEDMNKVKDMSSSATGNDVRNPSVFPEYPTDEEIHTFFKDDLYATKQTGCKITESWKGHGKAVMDIDPKKHFNASGHVMGGVVFTLADYAFAAASMPGSTGSVSLVSTIEFMKSTRGSKLVATCDADQSGRRVGFFTTDVYDDLDVHIARVVTTCYTPEVG